MDLHTGTPVWFECPSARIPVATEALEREVRCDVAIVGGGITGALLCDRLVAHGVETVLLDSRELGTGSTAASTGMLLAEPDTPVSKLAGALGAEDAARVLELGVWAVDELERVAEGLEADARVARRPCLYVASDERGAALLERELEARRGLGRPGARVSSGAMRERGFSFAAPLAMATSTSGEVNAYALTRGLLRRAAARGVRLFQPARVLAREPGPGGRVRLRTDAGPDVLAKAVILATGYEAHEQLNARLGDLYSTWVIASEPLAAMPGWPERTLLWETARPYLYFRTAGDRVIAGGLDECSADAHRDHGKLMPKGHELARALSTRFPQIAFNAATVWAGVFGASHDGLPYIGRVAADAPVYAALGYGGNGITFATMAAKLLTDAVRGVENPDGRLFRFGR